MLDKKANGLHPESQRLLWAIFYNQSSTHSPSEKSWLQLEQHGLIKRVDDRWQATPLAEPALAHYARYLKRDGLECPPKK